MSYTCMPAVSRLIARVTTACRKRCEPLKAVRSSLHTSTMSSSVDEVLRDGPYVWTVVEDCITTQRATSPAEVRPVKLPVFVTVPMAGKSNSTVPPGPFPVCVLLNGFQARASYYAPLARRLASWGLVVLQYNAPAFTIIPDSTELPFLTPVLTWLKDAVRKETQPALQGRADLDQLVIAGHSRGGKLAALHYSKGSVAGVPIKAAFLIDPVDNTAYTPESAAYPSASKALRACRKPFGMAVAGLISNSNPEGSNWKLFQAAAPAGSWVMQLKRAGHTTFMQPPTLAETWLLDRVFGGGPLRRDVAISQTAAAMLAWFRQQLHSQQPTAAGVQPVLAAAPLASTAFQAAAAAVTSRQHQHQASGATGTAASSAAIAENGCTIEATYKMLGSDFASAFQQWLVSPLVAEDVAFIVK